MHLFEHFVHCDFACYLDIYMILYLNGIGKTARTKGYVLFFLHICTYLYIHFESEHFFHEFTKIHSIFT